MRVPSSKRFTDVTAARAAIALVAVALLACVWLPASAAAKPHLKLVAPTTVEAPERVPFIARVPYATKRVAFYVDGERRWVDRPRGDRFHRSGYLGTDGMSDGPHKLRIRAKLSSGRVARTNRVIYLAKLSTKGGGGHKKTTTVESTPTTTTTTTTPSSSDLLFKGIHVADFPEIQAAPGAISEVLDPLGSGERALNFTVSDQDVYPITPTENPRAQAISPSLINSGDEFWMKTKFMLPQNFPSSVPGWMSLISIYGPPFNGSSPWRIGITGTEISWQRNATYGYDVPWRMPLTRGRWINVLLHERFGSNGWAEMWIDGNRVSFFPAGNYNPNHVSQTERLEMATMDSSNNGGANAAKIMQYRQAGMFQSATVYFGSLAIGRTRAAVES